MKIAIIGSGISGLISGYILNKKHNVVLYESKNSIGFSSEAISIENQSIDVPLRIISSGYYDNIIDFYKNLNIETETAITDISLYDDKEEIFVLHETNGLRYFKNIWKIIDLFIIYYYIKFKIESTQTFGEWIDQYKLKNNYFINIYLANLQWNLSCKYQDVLNYPAQIIINYCFSKPFAKNYWKKLSNGSINLSAKLSEKIDVRLSSNVSIFKENNKYIIKNNGKEEIFDKIIIATPHNAVSKLLKNIKDISLPLKYSKSKIIIHTDDNLTHKNKKALNTMSVDNKTQLTVWLNKYYDFESKTNYYQTWNPIQAIDPDKIIKEAEFTRPLQTKESVQWLKSVRKDQTIEIVPNVYLVGSYTVYGMTLLEEATTSALDTCKAIDIQAYDMVMNPKQKNQRVVNHLSYVCQNLISITMVIVQIISKILKYFMETIVRQQLV